MKQVSGWGPRMDFSNNFPGETAAALQGLHLRLLHLHTRSALECRGQNGPSFLLPLSSPTTCRTATFACVHRGAGLATQAGGGLLGPIRRGEMGKMEGLLFTGCFSGDTGRPHKGIQDWPTWQMTGIPSSYLTHRMGCLVSCSRHLGVPCALLFPPFYEH